MPQREEALAVPMRGNEPLKSEKSVTYFQEASPEWRGIKPVWCNESGARFQHIRREVC